MITPKSRSDVVLLIDSVELPLLMVYVVESWVASSKMHYFACVDVQLNEPFTSPRVDGRRGTRGTSHGVFY